MRKLNWLLTFIPFFLALGCASPKLTLQTSPDKAKVYAKPIESGQRVYLGETPLTIPHDKIESEYAGTGPIYIEFIKQGYLPYRVYITELALMQTDMRADLSPQTGLEDQESLNSIIEALFESQRLTKMKRYDEALRVLNQVQEKAPYISSIYEMKGGIFYLRAAYREAYDSYSKAVSLNPKNLDAQRMKAHLRTNFGYTSVDDPMDIQIRLPTSGPRLPQEGSLPLPLSPSKKDPAPKEPKPADKNTEDY